MMKYILFFLTSIVIFSSCTIEEHIHFNKDFSGKFERKIDISQFKAMAESMKGLGGDSTEQKMEDIPLDDLSGLTEMMKATAKFDELENIEGISNFGFNTNDEGSFTISFEFKDVKTLNKAYNSLAKNKGFPDINAEELGGGGFIPGNVPDNEENTEETKEQDNNKPDFEYFSKKGKYLIFRQPKKPKSTGNEELGGENMEMMKAMGGAMMTYKFKMSFDRKVKKVTKKNIDEFLSDDNSVRLNFNLDDMTNKDYETELKIKLK